MVENHLDQLLVCTLPYTVLQGQFILSGGMPWSVADQQFLFDCVVEVTALLKGSDIQLEEYRKPAGLMASQGTLTDERAIDAPLPS